MVLYKPVKWVVQTESEKLRSEGKGKELITSLNVVYIS
jgi:hypothetical protein